MIFAGFLGFHTDFHTKVKAHSLPYYLSIADGRIVGFILCSRVFAVGKMQTASICFELGLMYQGSYEKT